MLFINSKLPFKDFQEEYHKKYHNSRSLRGASVMNATGDSIDQSSMGFQYAIDTMTYIVKKITEQKFYEIAPADFVPLSVGEGSFSLTLLHNLVVNSSGDFEQGDLNQGSGNAKLETADAAVAPFSRKVKSWAKAVGYTLIEVEQALLANNWDVVESRQKARKKNWDLGIQKIAFLGHGSDSAVKGLLNQSTVNSNTQLITKSISTMNTSEFSAFVSGVIGAYLTNCNNTTMPDTFVMPLADYVGLAVPVSETYPNVMKIDWLETAFKKIVPGGVKIMPLAYAEAAQNKDVLGGNGKNRYVLYKKDEETLRMDIPVDLTITQPNTVNNFQFQDAGYGQYTGVGVMRPLEVLYFDYNG